MTLKYSLPLLAILVANSAYADDEFDYSAAPSASGADKQDKTWKGEAELGILVTTGNSEATNINGKLNIVHNMDKWRNTYLLQSLYTKSDDETTAEQYSGAAQGDYKFNDKEFWYIRGAYEKDRFSGYNYSSSVTSGYGSRVWQTEDGSFLELSAGLGYRSNEVDKDSDDYEEGDESDRGVITRLAGKFEYDISKTAIFRQELSTEVGLEDGGSISKSITSLQANIIGSLAMKLSYTIQYSSQVPTDTEKTDTETSVTLLYSF
ncbi:DUF481 domain-containing protein [Gallaecimonas mangrovi]|uniref:DUF481 domain-containing protein n=1 Tax=Gallaecimonas mangrovi TaxID=2291597 RepID=UPI000E206997|nr:DUF481 domain-containing protein [Gallaecimonas mangrovi]